MKKTASLSGVVLLRVLFARLVHSRVHPSSFLGATTRSVDLPERKTIFSLYPKQKAARTQTPCCPISARARLGLEPVDDPLLRPLLSFAHAGDHQLLGLGFSPNPKPGVARLKGWTCEDGLRFFPSVVL